MAKKKEEIQEDVTQIAEENAKELDNKKFVVDCLLATKREGVEGWLSTWKNGLVSFPHLAVVEITYVVSSVSCIIPVT